jgi:hypothetical protein
MPKPLCSFLMTTFGRAAQEPSLISEALYWYTTQTAYEDCELVLVNDAPGQILLCDIPGVRVVNIPDRFPTWGDKLNYGLSLCVADVVLPYDDDDVSLPNRAEQALCKLDGFEFWSPRLWWAHSPHLGKGYVHAEANGVGWNCACYRRRAFGLNYAPVYAEADARAFEYAEKHLKVNPSRPSLEELSYVYRFGVSSQHFSGDLNLVRAYLNMRPGKPGVYKVEPKMVTDWQAVCRAACRTSTRRTPLQAGSGS